MASIGFLIGGALVNALAFTGSTYLFSSLSKESIDKERKRHDKAIEDLQSTIRAIYKGKGTRSNPDHNVNGHIII